MKKLLAIILIIASTCSLVACTNPTCDTIEKGVTITNESTNLNDTYYMTEWFTYMNRCQVKLPTGFVVSGRLDSWVISTDGDGMYSSLIEVVIEGVPYITSINNVVMWYEVE